MADRLSLKGELEIAREIQLAMLPTGTYTRRRRGDLRHHAAGEHRRRRLLRRAAAVDDPDGRVIVTIGDVAGKGSPAALLMALLLAVLRTLVDEKLEARALVARLNTQICRHSPASRFITLFYGVYTPATGALTYVNAGQNPPLLRRADGTIERLGGTGIALGHVRGVDLRGASTTTRRATAICWCSTATASPKRRTRPGEPFEESGLERFIAARGGESPGRRWPPRSSTPSRRTRATRGSRTI